MPNCRSCRAPIVWVRTETGKAMPLDPDMEATGPWILIERPDDGEIIAVHRSKVVELTGEEDAASWPGRESHWSTCPNADTHRRAP